MGKRKIRFTDTVSLTPVSVPTEIQDWAGAPPSGASIYARIKATHSGIVTKNNGFYLPDKMRDSTGTWTDPFPKPILLHHPEKSGMFSPPSGNRDPVGRVASAQYIDLSPDIRDSWKEKGLVDQSYMSSALFDAFVKGQLSDSEVIDIVNRYFLSDVKLTNDPSFEGLGYIELVAHITDADAVQKVTDKRYLTGSISAATDKAVCSICKTNWADSDGPCDHSPGKSYDGTRCVLIAGNFDYSEYSFVNNPADRRSGVIELLNSQGEVEKSFSTEDSVSIPEISFTISDSTEEDKSMDLQEAKKLFEGHKRYQFENMDEFLTEALKDEKMTPAKLFALAEEKVDEDLRSISIKTGEMNEHKHTAYLDADGDGSTDWRDSGDDGEHTHVVVGFNVKAGGRDKHTHTLTNPLKIVRNDTDPVKDFFGDEYEEVIGDSEEGRLYGEMLLTLLDDVSDEDRDIVEQQIRDAKLSTKQRKKLASSTFCGPDRSFPVNDCAHYTAALRLLNRYKGEGSKEKIRACIERKGKRLNCGSKKEDGADVGEFVLGYFDHLEDEEVLQMSAGLLQVINERNLRQPGAVVTADSSLVEKLEKLAELEDEIKELNKELVSTQDNLVNAQNTIRSLKIEKIALLSLLSQDNKDMDAVKESLKDKSSEELDTTLVDLDTRFDKDFVVDKLFSGIVSNPATVPDPTLQSDNTTPKEVATEVLDKYKEIASKQGPQAAFRFMEIQKRRGRWPESN